MKKSKIIYLALFSVLFTSPLALYAQEQVKFSQTPLGKLVLNVLPIVIIITVVIWLFKKQTVSKDYLQRARDHMDKLESNTDEIVKELKEIKEELKKNNS